MKNEWFTPKGKLKKPIPALCIEDCSSPGDVSAYVKMWVTELNFKVPQKAARAYLKTLGFATFKQIDEMSLFDLAIHVLWWVCCDINEGKNFIGLNLEENQ